MSQAPSMAAVASSRQCLLLTGIDWQTYTRVLFALGEQPRVRLAFDRGALEIMSPSLEHDDEEDYLGDMVFILTEELGLPLHRGGSVTMRRKKLRKGIEADKCYWIRSAPRMAGRRRLDLRRDPPPDLAIEVDVSRSSLNRLSIYAALGVPEVWRLEENALTIYALGANLEYEKAVSSMAFPIVTAADLLDFVLRARGTGDQNPVLREFREWVRQKKATATNPPPSP